MPLVYTPFFISSIMHCVCVCVKVPIYISVNVQTFSNSNQIEMYKENDTTKITM